MPIGGRLAKQGGGGDSDAATSNLWIGNLSPNVTEADLMEVLAKFGSIEDLTSYSARNFAFVYFKHAESAKAAKAELQGRVIKGSAIKIEFAKPARPSKHLWVGGISSSVTKEHIEEEFARFGKIKEFKFLKDRNTALVEYIKLEDASAALKSMNGNQIGGENLRVDYLRSQPGRKEQFDFHDPRDMQFRHMGGPEPSWNSQDSMSFHSEAMYSSQKRQLPSEPSIGRKDGHPTRVLWVGYPPSVIIDENMLHNAMILFGEIEHVKCFPLRHYSFVVFRSVEEARNAKDNLQGKLFNDPRISIMFSSNESAFKDFVDPHSRFQGPRAEMLMNDPSLDAIAQHNHMGPNNFFGPPPGAHGPVVPRPFGPRGGFDGLLPTPGLNDSPMTHNPHDFGSPVGSNRRRISSPSAGILPPPVGSRLPNKGSGWDVLDANQIPRELKRARIDAGPPFNGSPYGRDQFSPADLTVPKGPIEVHTTKDHIWRGVIAKGGSTVCHARCIPVGKGIGFHLPDVVDCSARTGLDMLAKHYAEAAGFDIVFFLPDSEEDFASYTEFLRYLGSKSRAGVARFDDGTTMFLVPPSEFLTKVLNVVGPERLYGVVLKMARPTDVSSEQVHQSLPAVHHMDQPPVPLPYDYNTPSGPSQQEQVLHMGHNKFEYDGRQMLNANTQFQHTTEMAPQDTANNGPVSAPGSGVGLTPELIAALASLSSCLPGNTQASVQNPQVPLSSSTPMISNPTLGIDKVSPSQSWNQQHQYAEQMGQSSLQFVNQTNSQPHPTSNFQTYPPYSHMSSHPVQPLPDNGQYQNPSYGFSYNPSPQAAVSSQPLGMPPHATQGHQYAASGQPVQQYQQEAPHNASGYGMGNGVSATASYGFQGSQQPYNPMSTPSQYQGYPHPESNSALPESISTLAEPINQIEHHQPVTTGLTVDGEVDKNQRYQSTLALAANLLNQLHQKQQAGSHVGQGLDNQQ